MSRPLATSHPRFLLRPLNVLFGSPGHVPLLRALAQAGRGLTGREAARAAGIAQRGALDGLGRLENAGVVRRTPAGRAFLFELKRDTRMVRDGILPLLDVESGIRSGIFALLKKSVEQRVVSAWIFGSAARGEERADSDLDVLLLVEKSAEIEALQRRMVPVIDSLRSQFDVRPSLLVMTRAEFVRGFRAGKAFMKSVMADAETVAGKSPKAVIDGG